MITLDTIPNEEKSKIDGFESVAKEIETSLFGENALRTATDRYYYYIFNLCKRFAEIKSIYIKYDGMGLHESLWTSYRDQCDLSMSIISANGFAARDTRVKASYHMNETVDFKLVVKCKMHIKFIEDALLKIDG